MDFKAGTFPFFAWVSTGKFKKSGFFWMGIGIGMASTLVGVDSFAHTHQLIHRAPTLWPLRGFFGGATWLRFATGSVDAFAPAHLALRVNLRLISRAAALAAWVCTLHQTFDFPVP